MQREADPVTPMPACVDPRFCSVTRGNVPSYVFILRWIFNDEVALLLNRGCANDHDAGCQPAVSVPAHCAHH